MINQEEKLNFKSESLSNTEIAEMEIYNKYEKAKL